MPRGLHLRAQREPRTAAARRRLHHVQREPRRDESQRRQLRGADSCAPRHAARDGGGGGGRGRPRHRRARLQEPRPEALPARPQTRSGVRRPPRAAGAGLRRRLAGARADGQRRDACCSRGRRSASRNSRSRARSARTARRSCARRCSRAGCSGFIGGVGGALLGIWGTRAFVALAPLDLPRREAVVLDWSDRRGRHRRRRAARTARGDGAGAVGGPHIAGVAACQQRRARRRRSPAACDAAWSSRRSRCRSCCSAPAGSWSAASSSCSAPIPGFNADGLLTMRVPMPPQMFRQASRRARAAESRARGAGLAARRDERQRRRPRCR